MSFVQLVLAVNFISLPAVRLAAYALLVLMDSVSPGGIHRAILVSILSNSSWFMDATIRVFHFLMFARS